jgi:hypothetical protein
VSKKDSNDSGATPVGLLRYAFEYYAAAKATDDAIGDDDGHEIHAPMVVNFLIGQSIELALKSFLLHSGVSMRTLKNNPYRHDLVELFRASMDKNLIDNSNRSNKILNMVELLCGPYKERELQYYKGGVKERFPVHGPLDDAARAILAAVRNVVPGAETLNSRKAVAVFLASHGNDAFQTMS